jgi:adenosine deaminase
VIELHLHLEGSLRPATVAALAHQHDPGSPFATADWSDGYWTFRDLPGFLTELDPVLRACLRTPADWHRAAVECFADLAAQGVVYAEPSIAARLPGRPGYLPVGDVLAAVESARRLAALQIGLIVGFSRHSVAERGADGPRFASDLVTAVLRARDAGAHVVGIDLHGDERTLLDLLPLAPAFDAARAAGLGVRVHAGEAVGPESVWNALHTLRPGRIGHGVRAAEDSSLVRYLAEHQVALDLCPTSNVRTRACASLAEFPIRQLFDAGVPVTVSSDDPLAFQTNLARELELVRDACGFSAAELQVLQAHAARHAFEQVRAPGWPEPLAPAPARPTSPGPPPGR